jgi:hypothetical protein
MARSLIRDAAMNWARDELVADPEAVCEQLSGMIGEEYDFDTGEVKPKDHKTRDHKTSLFADTVLRNDGAGNLFLMNHPETGWRSFAIPIPSENYLLEHYNVTLGKWTADKYGEYCPVHKKETNEP